jgi:hypothetical protein
MVATDVLPLVHTPPVTALLNVVVAPAHTVAVPVIEPADGAALTVTAAMVVAVPQSLVTVYVIAALPLAMPVTTPLALPTIATPVLLLLHIPPDAALVNVIVLPTHTVDVPIIAPASGDAFT